MLLAEGQIVENTLRFESNTVAAPYGVGPQGIANRDGTASIKFVGTVITFTGTMAISGALTLPAGTASAPSLNATGSLTTGLYWPAAGVLGVALSGVPGLAIGSSAPTLSAAAGVAGSSVYVRAASAGAGTAFAGGLINITSGVGSAATGANTGGAGGAYVEAAGAGGTTVTGTGGVGGAASFSGGAGGVASGAGTGGAGGATTIAAGAGGNGGTTGGAGGSVAITAGNAGTGGNANGGNIALTPGTATGSGTPGAVIAVGLRTSPISAAAITTTRTLTVQDSGGTFSVAKSSAYAITLPTPTQGLRYKFMVLDTGANAVTISDGAAHLFGIASIANVNTALTGTTLTLAATGSVGDWVEFVGIDSTHYLVTGACIAAGDITIA